MLLRYPSEQLRLADRGLASHDGFPDRMPCATHGPTPELPAATRLSIDIFTVGLALRSARTGWRDPLVIDRQRNQRITAGRRQDALAVGAVEIIDQFAVSLTIGNREVDHRLPERPQKLTTVRFRREGQDVPLQPAWRVENVPDHINDIGSHADPG